MTKPILSKLTHDAADIERFWQKVDIRGDDECWPWKEGVSERGYGVFWVQGTNVRANRFALFVEKGEPENPDHLSLHECDNTICCNPQHLRWGDNMDNTQDFVLRHGGFKGEKSPNAIIKSSDVRQIYSMRLEGWTIPEIAKEMGLPNSVVENVYTGSSWQHMLGVDGNPTLEQLREKRTYKTKRKANNRILTDEMVDYILTQRMAGVKIRQIANQMGLPLGTVSPVFCGLAMTHRLGVNGNPTFAELKSVRAVSNSVKLSSDDKAEIAQLLAQGYVGKDIAKRYNVSTATISHIKNGKH